MPKIARPVRPAPSAPSFTPVTPLTPAEAQGILQRADRRGAPLPDQLRIALQDVADGQAGPA